MEAGAARHDCERFSSRASGAVTGSPIPVIRGLGEIALRYEGLIIDLWGVIHGGIEPYPGVLQTLDQLRASGRPAALLSNAPRRADAAARRLAEIGVPATSYTRLITSGEVGSPPAMTRTTQRSAGASSSSGRPGTPA